MPEAAIRLLIEGGRGGFGWRSDDAFYSQYVCPTFSDRSDWDSWAGGAWQRYWFAFWSTLRDFYNAQAKEEKHDREAKEQTWEGAASPDGR